MAEVITEGEKKCAFVAAVSKRNVDQFCSLEYVSHLPHLPASLFKIALVNADGVNPEPHTTRRCMRQLGQGEVKSLRYLELLTVEDD
ncbi:hypothetical protein BM221_004693 [Beauveria bassiana]|uniref:Uncharacterized protein n=1 Tax=Beauveria bassiana TaxID=176275 RepID=A0A2N6NS00_BEABA|nr:hypothetical protein BM221_004693 [Beauveria bassiana]